MHGINLIGFAKGSYGLGVTTRVMAKKLIADGIPFCIVDITSIISPKRDNFKEDFVEFEQYFSDRAIYDVNLIIFGVSFFKKGFTKIEKAIEMRGKFNVLMPFLENYELGRPFLMLKNKFDMYIAPTRFIQYALMRQIDNAYIEYMPPPLFIDRRIKATLSKGKMKDKNKKFTFYFNFDLNSGIDRKNPYLLIRSFLEEFGNDDTVLLVLKVTGADLKQNAGLVVSLSKIAADKKNIQIIFDYLSYDQNLKLIASADCYVSPHRSEGLGNGLFEAMQLGVPCIATGYGGNADFMNHNNSILIKYELEYIMAKDYRSWLGALKDYWGNPSHLELMFAMRSVREDTKLRERIIENARNETNQLQEKFIASNVFEAIFTKYEYEKTKGNFSLRRTALV